MALSKEKFHSSTTRVSLITQQLFIAWNRFGQDNFFIGLEKVLGLDDLLI